MLTSATPWLQKASKAQQAETKAINQSLSAFNTCLQRLWHTQMKGAQSVIIPVRDSALTRILADMMTGHGRLVLSVHISVEERDLEQTLRTLEFAMRASTLKTNPAVKLPQNVRARRADVSAAGGAAAVRETVVRFTLGHVPTECGIALAVCLFFWSGRDRHISAHVAPEVVRQSSGGWFGVAPSCPTGRTTRSHITAGGLSDPQVNALQRACPGGACTCAAEAAELHAQNAALRFEIEALRRTADERNEELYQAGVDAGLGQGRAEAASDVLGDEAALQQAYDEGLRVGRREGIEQGDCEARKQVSSQMRKVRLRAALVAAPTAV